MPERIIPPFSSIPESPEDQKEKQKRDAIELLRRGGVSEAIDVLTKAEIPLTDTEIITVAKEKCIARLRDGYAESAFSLLSYFSLSPDDPDIREAAKEGCVTCLRNGDIGSALKIFRRFSFSPDIREAAKEGCVTCLRNGDIGSALEIFTRFSLPTDDPDIRQAAKEGCVTCLRDGDADSSLELLMRFSLSPDDPDIEQALVERLMQEMLSENREGVKEFMDYIPSARGKVYEEIRKQPNRLLQFLDYFEGVATQENIQSAYETETEKIRIGDPEVKENFETLETLLGASRVKRLFLSSPSFWANPHDQLLFMNVFRSRSEQDQLKIVRMVFEPLLVPGVSLDEVNQILSSFDPDIYEDFRGGVPFRTFQEFAREVEMQIHDIRVPEGASEAFANAVSTLMLAPGVDVPFIRTMIDAYEKEVVKKKMEGYEDHTVEFYERKERESDQYQPGRYDEYYFDDQSGRIRVDEETRRENQIIAEERSQRDPGEYHDEYEDEFNEWETKKFSRTLINIIEGKDAIDERQVIKPWEDEIDFDPLHKVFLANIGVRGFNEQSPKLFDAFQKHPELRSVIAFLQEKDRDHAESLKKERDEKKTTES